MIALFERADLGLSATCRPTDPERSKSCNGPIAADQNADQDGFDSR